jgi:hypothetical protein
LYDPNDAIGDLEGAQVAAVSGVQNAGIKCSCYRWIQLGEPARKHLRQPSEMVRVVAVDHRVGNHGIHGCAATVSVSDRAGDFFDLYRLDADTCATRNQHPLF